MTRLDAIKTALRGLDPSGFVEDMAWLLAQVEALAGALRQMKRRDGDDGAPCWCLVGRSLLGHGDDCRRATAALAALEAPDA